MSIDPPLAGDGGRREGAWSELGAGVPTIAALAELCSRALASQKPPQEELTLEARTLLFAARNRGVFEVKGVQNAFESPARLIAVYVELDSERTLVFRSPLEPSVTIRFLDGFRQLCRTGLVMHQLHHDFSLTRAGFEAAAGVAEKDVREALALAVEQTY